MQDLPTLTASKHAFWRCRNRFSTPLNDIELAHLSGQVSAEGRHQATLTCGDRVVLVVNDAHQIVTLWSA